jgi:predicted branched-subunit amino acid permease
MTDTTEPDTAAGGHDWNRLRREVVRDAAAVGVAVGTYGVAYGALGTTSGLSVTQTCTLSVLAFTGGSQFALVGVLGAGGAAVSGVATALMLGFRNSLYGLRLAPTLQVRGLRRLFAAHLVIDETTAMTISQPRERAGRLAFWATGLAVFTLWNIATVVGALGASALGDPNRFGLDAAVPAAFLGLLWPRLGSATTRAVAVGAAMVALILTPRLSPGIPVLVAGLVAVAVGLARPSSAQEAT